MIFIICFSTRQDVATVQVRGEMDAGNAHSVQTCLDAAVDGHRVVIVDLSRVPFMDCAAFGVILAAARHAAGHQSRLVLAQAQPIVLLLLHALQLEQVLCGRRTVEQEQREAALTRTGA